MNRKVNYSCDIKLRIPKAREASGPRFLESDDFANCFEDIKNIDREVFCAITLSQTNQQIDKHMISMGTLTNTLVHPREAFKAALLDNAAAIAFVHNHPSGDVTPSREDITLTERLKDAGELLGIRVLDHIIIGRDKYMSFVDEGML